jgi:acetyl-CoA C-acetyltransferase
VQPERIPVIVGAGEITHRTKDPAEGLEPIALMECALREAERDAGAALLAQMDSLDIVCEVSWPYVDAASLLTKRIGAAPARAVNGPVGGESPVRYIHEAALRIARGESQVGAIVGAESNYSVVSAEKAGLGLPWSPKDPDPKIERARHWSLPVTMQHGLFMPPMVYPLYENATLAAWGQTPREALAESGLIWSRFSEVAASNPYAWSREPFTAEQITAPSDRNRLIAWPYTLRMVANSQVNQGAAIIVTSLAHALELGIPRERLIYPWCGAAAKEPRHYLERDQYARSHAQDAVFESLLDQVGGIERFALIELYSCFPVVPKLARRTLGLPATAPLTCTGGLSFFGAPLNNYMTHAAAALVRGLREQPGKLALLYGQGEFVTKHHAIVLGSLPPERDLLNPDYSVQDIADARRGPVPPLVLEYAGKASLETFTIVYQRDGRPEFGAVLGRTPEGGRLMARVDAGNIATLAMLTDQDKSPVGSLGEVSSGADGLLRWTAAA